LTMTRRYFGFAIGMSRPLPPIPARSSRAIAFTQQTQ
jgi:hypothetical protein